MVAYIQTHYKNINELSWAELMLELMRVNELMSWADERVEDDGYEMKKEWHKQTGPKFQVTSSHISNPRCMRGRIPVDSRSKLPISCPHRYLS